MKQEGRHIVLGSAGFIGKYLVDFLRHQGKFVVEWDIKNDISQDCRTADLGLRADDIVYFLAWEVGGAKYLNRQDTQMEQYHNNLDLMQNVFWQLAESGSRFVFASSQLACVNTVYGSMKRLGELATKWLGGCSLRFWNVYGPYETPSIRSHVISDFIYQALSDGKITCITSGEEKRQFIHVNDICSAIQNVLDRNDHEIYDATSFEWITIARVAEFIAGYLNVDIVFGTKKEKPRRTCIKGKIPGWNPQISFATGLRQTINLHKTILGYPQC